MCWVFISSDIFISRVEYLKGELMLFWYRHIPAYAWSKNEQNKSGCACRPRTGCTSKHEKDGDALSDLHGGELHLLDCGVLV